MKRLLLAVLFAALLTLSAPSVQAEESEAVVLIYAEVPTEWSEPHIWTWDADGAAAYANLGWPGKPMKADPNNAGWYYLYVPASMTNVIINADQGTVQTEAFDLAGSDVWVTITATEVTEDDVTTTVYTPTASTTQATTGDLPTYIATKYIFAYVPIDWDSAGIWAWNFDSGEGVFPTWPGEEMTLLDDGWFRAEIPDTADRVIINNLVASEGEQTVDLTVGTEDVYIRITEPNDDGQYEAELTDTKPVIITDGYTLYITVPDGWDTPHIWAWSHPDGTNVYTTWPGEPIAYDEDAGYYTVLVPTWVNRVIVNNGIVGDGAEQTVDTEFTNADDVYLYIGDTDDEGKYLTTLSATPIDDNEPINDDDTTTDDDTDSGNTAWIVSIVALGVLAIGGGAFFFIKRS